MISINADNIHKELQDSLDGLIRLARSKDEQDRVSLGVSVSELIQLRLDPVELDLVTDILLDLIRQVECDLQENLSERLAIMDNAPQRLIQTLAKGEITVARPVLMKSCLLEDEDLIYIIKSKGKEHWKSIAQRENMSDGIINMLVMTDDVETIGAVLSNDNICIPNFAIEKSSKIAKKHRVIADLLSLREEVNKNIAAELYWLISVELREKLIQNYALDPELLDNNLEEILQEYLDGMICRYTITSEMLELADRFGEVNNIGVSVLLKVLRRGQIAFFIALFAKVIDLPIEVVEKMVRQDSGQGMAIACCAIGVERTEWVTIYLLTQPYRSQERLVDHDDLQMALRYYDKVTPDLARKIIEETH